MSVQSNQYIMYGVQIPFADEFERYEDYVDSAFNPSYNLKNNITVLFDGMDGDYIFIGHVIAKSNNHMQFDTEVIELGIDGFDKPMIEEFITRKFEIGDAEFKWYCVTHAR